MEAVSDAAIYIEMMSRPSFALSKNARTEPVLHAFFQLLKWGFVYFAIVFAVGFLLGILRVSLLEPLLGTRWSELLEMPWMGAAMFVTTAWLVRQTRGRRRRTDYAAIGIIALALMLIAEVVVVVGLRGISLVDYAAERDRVSGMVYLMMLAVFAVLPWLYCRIDRSRRRRAARFQSLD